MKIVVVLLLTVVCTQGAVFIAPNSKHPDHPGKCYYKGPPDVFINFGETIQMPYECGRLICSDDYVVQGHTCPAIGGIPKGCRNVRDLKKPYPGCCINIVCK